VEVQGSKFKVQGPALSQSVPAGRVGLIVETETVSGQQDMGKSPGMNWSATVWWA